MKNGNNYQGKRGAPDGECLWKGGVPQTVLEKCRIKRKSVKSKLRSAEGGRVKVCRMKLRSAERGGQAVWIEIEGSRCRQRSTDGIEECLSPRRSTKNGWVRSVECIIGVPEGIEELPSLPKKCGNGGKDCRMG